MSFRLALFVVAVLSLAPIICESTSMDIVIEDAEDASVEIAYESEKERDERTRLCDKVKKKAEEIVLQASDGYDEITITSPLVTPEVHVSIDYIISQATGIINLADDCIEKNNKSDDQIRDKLAIIETELTEPSSVDDTKDDVKDLDCLLDCSAKDFADISESFLENAENIITAGRDMFNMVEEDNQSTYESQRDAKDTKEEIKALCYDIIDYATDLSGSTDDFEENVLEGVEKLEVAVDVIQAENSE